MPSLGADMDEGTVTEWLVHPGDRVHRGDIVAVVDTDKADVDVEIFENGVIEEILVPAGERVAVGTPLAVVRPAVPSEDGAVPTTAAPVPAPPAPPVPPPEAPVTRARCGAGPCGDSFAGLAALGPPLGRRPRHGRRDRTGGGAITRRRHRSRSARCRGCGPRRRPRRRPCTADRNVAMREAIAASHGAFQAGDTALLPRHRRRLLSAAELGSTSSTPSARSASVSFRLCSSSRPSRSRRASTRSSTGSGSTTTSSRAKESTSGWRSRSAAVG